MVSNRANQSHGKSRPDGGKQSAASHHRVSFTHKMQPYVLTSTYSVLKTSTRAHFHHKGERVHCRFYDCYYKSNFLSWAEFFRYIANDNIWPIPTTREWRDGQLLHWGSAGSHWDLAEQKHKDLHNEVCVLCSNETLIAGVHPQCSHTLEIRASLFFLFTSNKWICEQFCSSDELLMGKY